MSRATKLTFFAFTFIASGSVSRAIGGVLASRMARRETTDPSVQLLRQDQLLTVETLRSMGGQISAPVQTEFDLALLPEDQRRAIENAIDQSFRNSPTLKACLLSDMLRSIQWRLRVRTQSSLLFIEQIDGVQAVLGPPLSIDEVACLMRSARSPQTLPVHGTPNSLTFSGTASAVTFSKAAACIDSAPGSSSGHNFNQQKGERT